MAPGGLSVLTPLGDCATLRLDAIAIAATQKRRGRCNI
jgi:hypothetical protein